MKIQGVYNNIYKNRDYLNTCGRKSVCTSPLAPDNPENFKPLSSVQNSFFYIPNSPSFGGMQCSPSTFNIKHAYGIDCPCCGQPMLTHSQVDLFAKRTKDKKGDELQNELLKKYEFYRPNEREIVDILVQDSKMNPEFSLSDIVSCESAGSLNGLEVVQKNIIEDMKTKTKDLSPDVREYLGVILDDALDAIDDSNDDVYFKRKDFISRIQNSSLFLDAPDRRIIDSLVDEAETMPSSSTSKDAFFVKYSRRSNEEIARRLVLPALSTTEHIVPQSRDGANDIENYIPLCGKCNSERGNTPYDRWFAMHPEMPVNLQKYILQVSDMIENREFAGYQYYDTYVDDVIKTIYTETGGKLKLKTPEEYRAEIPPESSVQPPPSDDNRKLSLDEIRDAQLREYESLLEEINLLNILYESLKDDEEFLLIQKYAEKNSSLSALKAKGKDFRENLRILDRNHKRSLQQLKEATDKGSSPKTISQLRAKCSESGKKLSAAKTDFSQNSAQIHETKRERNFFLRQITTPEQISEEIHNLQLKKANVKQQAETSGVLDESLIETYDAKIAELKKRKAEVVRKFKNVNIETRIQELTKEAESVLQKFVDSFDVPYQHSNPKEEQGVSSSSS